MSTVYQQRLASLEKAACHELLRQGLKGLERESLRVDEQGTLAYTPHPPAWGQALTNPWITTDYSESLLELVTPAFADAHQALAHLQNTTAFCYATNPLEWLWPSSMPCPIDNDREIPVAQFGSSHAGRFKVIYRHGLGHRYGRMMQMIAGIHFNYSVAEDLWPLLARLDHHSGDLRAYRDQRYFDLLRNVRRLGWLISYLFGASPALDKSFLQGQTTDKLADFDPTSLLGQHSTSLRLSDVGYSNGRGLNLPLRLNFDNLDSFLADLRHALLAINPHFSAIGVKDGDQYRQLNDRRLQIENEYYTAVRAKQITKNNETLSQALHRRGVAYVELRLLDNNPLQPLGIGNEDLFFLELFMLYCLLQDSPPLSATQRETVDNNLNQVALHGREKTLTLCGNQGQIALSTWAEQVLEAMAPLAQFLDSGLTATPYQKAWQRMQQRIADPSKTPSAQVHQQLEQTRHSFAQWHWQLAQQHRATILTQATDKQQAQLQQQVVLSRQQQAALEQNQQGSFEEYLAAYFARADQPL